MVVPTPNCALDLLLVLIALVVMTRSQLHRRLPGPRIASPKSGDIGITIPRSFLHLPLELFLIVAEHLDVQCLTLLKDAHPELGRLVTKILFSRILAERKPSRAGIAANRRRFLKAYGCPS